MQQAGYHHANMLASQMRDNLNNQQVEMMAMMQSMMTEPPSAQEFEQPMQPITSEIQSQQVANAVVADNVQLQMLQILQTMQAAQQQGRRNNRGGGQNTGNQNGGGRERVNRRTPDDATFNRRDITKYCHTHGACNHTSSECNRKAPGHKNTATLTNRMGGVKCFL